MHIRCPHCHHPIEIVEDALFSDLSCPSCGSNFSLLSGETTAAHAGGKRQLAHFELVRELGFGAFGSVWMARDTKLNRTVAIKIPRKDTLSGSESELFLRDARAAAQLKHPNIVGVHEVGRENGTLYIVSDYIEGANLKEWLSGQRLSFRESAELVARVAEALEHAHRAGVVHRDLKPGNIMLDRDGQPHVIDFGLAKRDSGEITMTVDGHVLGTPAYMSPEQAAGTAHHADARSDVYSLGVILFELLTGELPFRGEKQMLILQIQRDEPPRLRKLNAKVPRDLETVALKCLEKEPGKRYQTGQSLADDLRSWLEGKPILARPIGPAARGWRWCKRNPAVAGLTAAVALALISGTAASSYFAIQADAEARGATAERDRADKKAIEATSERDRADRKAAEAEASAGQARDEKEAARRLLYRADMNLAQRAWEEADIKLVTQLLAQHEPKEDEPDLRGWEWYYQRRLVHSDLRTLQGHTKFVFSVAFSPDGRQLASASGDRTIERWDVETGANVGTLKGHTSSVDSICFSPDGRHVASAGWDSMIKLWDAASGAELSTFKGHTKEILGLSFSPDGRQLVSASKDGTIKLWNVETVAELRTLQGNSKIESGVSFSPDGRQLASAHENNTIQVSDAETGEVLRTLENPLNFVRSSYHPTPIFSPDGRCLVSSQGDRTIQLWDLESGALLRTLQGHISSVSTVAFSPDGRRIVSAGSDRTIKLWDAETGAELRTLKGHTGEVSSVSFSPDGRLLATSDGQSIKLWDVEAEVESRTLRGHTQFVAQFSFSPDGKQIASASVDQTVRVWDTSSGLELRTLRGREPFWSISFSPDRRILAAGGWRGMIHLWAPGAEARTLRGHAESETVNYLSFSPDGRRLASVCHETTKLWDVESGAELCTLKGHKGSISRVSFSPDGRRVASASQDKTIKLWDVESGAELRTLQGHKGPVYKVSFSPDGRRLASASVDKTVKLWDAETGVELRTLKGHTDFVFSVSFSPDGRRLASASLDKTAKLWDVETGVELPALQGRKEGVPDISFSPDGRRRAVAELGTIKLLDVATGVEMRTLKGHEEHDNASFSPDGQQIVSHNDRTLRLWDTALLTPDEKMGRFLARQIVADHPIFNDAIAEIKKQTRWNDAMRSAAIQWVERSGLKPPAAAADNAADKPEAPPAP